MFGSHLFADTLFAYRARAFIRWQAICKAASDWDNQSVNSDSWANQSEAGSSWEDQQKSNLQNDKC